MAPTDTPDAFVPFPPEMVRYVSGEAERDADAVIALLTAAGIRPHSPPRFTREVLLAFAAVVRMYRWEEAGLAPHRAAGLPSAAEAHAEVLRVASVRPGIPAPNRLDSLTAKAFAVAVERIAWAGRLDLRADIQLDTGDDDEAFVEAMAQFLWRNRRRSGTPTEERTDG